MWPLDLSLTAPFALDDVVVRVTLDDGSEVPCVLRRGRLQRDFPSRPLRIRLSAEPPPAGETLALAPPVASSTPDGTMADVAELFEHGWDVPPDGRLTLKLLWGAHCHGQGPPSDRRFASIEHMACAELVGLDAQGARLRVAGATIDHATRLHFGAEPLTFGEIVALGGDFYAHLDAGAIAAFPWAWPEFEGVAGWVAGDYRATTLSGDDPEAIRVLLDVIERDRTKHRNVAGEFAALAVDTIASDYPARRYLALSSQNFCHFVCPAAARGDDTNEALRLYRAYHDRAIADARAATRAVDPERAMHEALAVDAFGCHFLTDLFASGHLRVPRRALGERYGLLRGSLYMSLRMHNEDNEAGLWCTTRLPTTPRQVWRAFGDGMLLSDAAQPHLARVKEAVRRSAAEVLQAHAGVEVPVADRAEAVLPVPLLPGEGPGATDDPPYGGGDSRAPRNGWPLYWFAPSGRPIERLGPATEPRYRYVDDYLDVAEEDR